MLVAIWLQNLHLATCFQKECDPGQFHRVRFGVPEPAFPEHILGGFVCSPFGALLIPLAPFWQLLISFWFPFGVLLPPCWSIWFHFGALKLTLRPTTPPKLFVFVCFDSFRFWIVFKWIPADLCIDLGIVVQPNVYHLSPFVFYFEPASTTPNSKTPHTQKHEIWRSGMRARWTSTNLQAPKPQRDPHTLPGQSLKYNCTTFGLHLFDLCLVLGPSQ